MDFAVPVDHRVKIKESEKKDEGDGNTNCNWCTWNGPQKLGKKLKQLEIRGRTETTQTTALLRSAKILRGALMT